MTQLVNGELQIVVPVGMLLDREQEVALSVPRGEGSSLPIRLRLVPARTSAAVPEPVTVAAGCCNTVPSARRHTDNDDEPYPIYDIGVGD